jgi:hypothetical protein
MPGGAAAASDEAGLTGLRKAGGHPPDPPWDICRQMTRTAGPFPDAAEPDRTDAASCDLFLRLLTTTAVTLFGVAVIVFFVIRVVPGNPIAMMLPPGATEEDVARLSALYGLDKSIPEQFGIWSRWRAAGRFRHLDHHAPAGAGPGAGPPAGHAGTVDHGAGDGRPGRGVGADRHALRGTRTEGAIDVANGMALSVPDFLWGLVLILVFGVLAAGVPHLGPHHARRWNCRSPPISTCSKALSGCVSTSGPTS